ncbi:MAG: hypothetical protein A2161_10605, partial [Candidatus Schekmanbacteria bacterium RBG_13_48_7]
LRPEILEEGAIRGLLLAAKPYNDYISTGKDADSKVSSMKKGSSGVLIGHKDRVWTVMSIIPDSAAQKAGLKIGDKIYQIDDQMIQNCYLSEIYGKLSGQPGEKRTMTIFRGEKLEQVSIEMELEPIKSLDYVTSKIIDDNIAYIRVANFNPDKFKEEFSHTLENLLEKDVRGLILDLRNNCIGEIEQGFELCDFFLEDGKLMGFYRRNPESSEMRFLSSDHQNYDVNPLIILVDSSTSSATEVAVAAFKDLKRGLILGESTFGKALHLETFEMNNSLLRLVTGLYYSPNGDSIYKNGIKPQIEMKSESYFLTKKPLEEDPLVVRAIELITAHYVFDNQPAEKPSEL